MFSLLLDSAGRDLNVALARDQQIVDRISYSAWQRQSELMVKEIDAILRRNALSFRNVGEVIVTIGPGSYTGIRIALTIAKTIAFALGVKIFAVSSLKAQKLSNLPTISIINARSNRSYFAAFDKDGSTIIKDSVLDNDQVKKWVIAHPHFRVSGDVDYLGIASDKPNVLQGMLDDRSLLSAADDILTLKPIYLKDLL